MGKGPKTVAIFMDGNRRWAKAHNVSVREGYQAGKNVFLQFLDFYSEVRHTWGTENYIFYAFSTENWSRPTEEVAMIMGAFENAFDDFHEAMPRIKSAGIKIRFVGNRDRLSRSLIEKMEKTEEETAEGKSGTIALALSYGGRDDILQAANALADQRIPITAASLESKLWTLDIPEPDLIIRPGGEMRLSNFLTWQAAYSELAFTKTLWPDFNRAELEKIFDDYSRHERRRGK